MTSREIRSLLSVYRAGDGEAEDSRFDEARKEAEIDHALAQWWAEEQELDRLIGSKLQNTNVPSGLKARLLARRETVIPYRTTWGRKLALLAAVVAILAVLFSSWRGPFQPAVSLADYRDEMVGFIKVAPALELETKQLSGITAFLEKAGAPARFAIPEKIENLEPVGCRTLRFRGNDVTLVCFKREDGKLLHLFVVNRAALPHFSRDGDRNYSAQGEWMTAAWAEGDQAFLMTVQGDRTALEKYLTTS